MYKQPGFSNSSYAKSEMDKFYENNPRDTSGDQEGVEYDRDGRVTGGFENFKSEAYYDHDMGKNLATDRWGETYNPGGNVYTSDQAGIDAWAKQNNRDFGSATEDNMPDYLRDTNAQLNSNMEAVDVTPQMQADREASTKPSTPSMSGPSARDKRLSNFREGKKLKRESVSDDKSLSWRQSRRLKSGDGNSRKSQRQLKRLRNQEARKSQRAKNRRERGWGGFGWNRKR